jgi:hypothetical protein
MISQWAGEKSKDQLIADTKIYGPMRVELGRKVCDVMDKWEPYAGKHFVESGTLLGGWRNGQMIPHDDDFDMGVYVSQEQLNDTYGGSHDAFCGAMCERMQAAGLHARCTLTYCKKVEVFLPEHGKYLLKPDIDFHNVTVDITLFVDHPTNKGNMGSTHTRCQFIDVPLADMWPTAPVHYCGYDFKGPRLPESFLTSMYGYLGLGAVYNPETGLYEKKEDFEARQALKAKAEEAK